MTELEEEHRSAEPSSGLCCPSLISVAVQVLKCIGEHDVDLLPHLIGMLVFVMTDMKKKHRKYPYPLMNVLISQLFAVLYLD